jgi:hypothetical protein
MSTDKATLMNLRYVDGVLKQVFIDKDGKETITDIEGVQPPKKSDSSEFNERFAKTETIPSQDVGPKTSPLIKKDIAKEYTHAVQDTNGMLEFIQKHMDTTLALHAMMIEVLGAPENFDHARAEKARTSLNKNLALKAMVLKQLKLLGDVWQDAYDKLTT